MEGLQQLRPRAWGKEKVHGFGLNPKYPIILFGGIQKPAKKNELDLPHWSTLYLTIHMFLANLSHE